MSQCPIDIILYIILHKFTCVRYVYLLNIGKTNLNIGEDMKIFCISDFRCSHASSSRPHLDCSMHPHYQGRSYTYCNFRRNKIGQISLTPSHKTWFSFLPSANAQTTRVISTSPPMRWGLVCYEHVRPFEYYGCNWRNSLSVGDKAWRSNDTRY